MDARACASLSGRRRSRRRAASAWLTALAVAGGPVLAQTPSPALTIDEAFAVTLKQNPDVHTARATADVDRGALVQSARPFDVKPSVALGGTRTVGGASSGIDTAASSYTMLGAESRVSVSRMLRSGITASTEVAMTRQTGRDGDAALSQLVTVAGVSLPLLQGKSGGIYTAIEDAARLDHRASGRMVRAVAADAVLQVAHAYWAYRAAYRRAEIQQAAAGRSQQAVEEVRILIAADERPKSDIDLMLANAATKRATALAAEQAIEQARHALGLVMGVDVAVITTLPVPATDFPDAEATPALALDRLTADALARHDELAAARTRQESTQVMRQGAASQLRPRADLVLESSYTAPVGGGAGRLFDTLGVGRGPNFAVQLVFEPSAVNSTLRGLLIQTDARHVQAGVAVDALERSVRIAVANALVALNSARAQLASTREAVEQSLRARDTVQRNFEVGAATLFDRILAEDTKTNAELADLAARQRYAVALADLQFARGVIVENRGPELTAHATRVLRATAEDARE